MNDPKDLTDEQVRKQFFPVLFNKSWVPVGLVRWVIRRLRTSALRTLNKMDDVAHLTKTCDYHITVGDQVHGIQERGAIGEAGRQLLIEFRVLTRRFATAGKLFHVPSEHPLGYWEGEDYFPHWDRKHKRFGVAIRRDIGGRMNLEAIENWQREMGPLWGHKEVEGLHLVWLTGDFFRWRRYVRDIPALSELWKQQEDFLEQTLSSVPDQSVILFTHRPGVVFDDPRLQRFQEKLRAVIFGDYHDTRRAEKAIAKFPPHRFALWFVPALWGMQFGLGHCGYAVLTLDNGQASFKERKLTYPTDADWEV